MKKNKKTNIYTLIAIITIILLDLYSFYSFSTLANIGLSTKILAHSINLLWTLIALLAITYGFIKRKKWLKLIATMFLTWSIIWFIGILIIEKTILQTAATIGICLILLVYFVRASDENLFTTRNIDKKEKNNVFKLGEYTLYKREIKTKGKKTRVLYYLSKKRVENGQPCQKPPGYEVFINKKGIPYIKKSER